MSSEDVVLNAINNYNVEIARSRLRDPNNRRNSGYIGKLLSQNVIDNSFFNPIPKKYSSRVVKETATPSVSRKKITAEDKSQFAIVVDKVRNVNILPDFRYNPDAATEINEKFKFNQTVSFSNFLNTNPVATLGPKRLNTNPTPVIQLARRYYLHAMFMNMVNKTNDAKIIPTEGFYIPGPTEIQFTDIENEENHNLDKVTGHTVVYKVLDSQGRENNRLTYDIAAFFKDVAFFDTMTLSYDTLEGELKLRIILKLPFTFGYDDSYTDLFNRSINTEYNNTRHASNEFVEITL
tara:strand:- start:980 stop:1858 length:879 start_codon:yes stop_codon:yes gene_type:complete